MTNNDTWSQVPALVRNLPDGLVLKRELLQRIRTAYAELDAERGEVHVPEDTFRMQRLLAASRDQFDAYLEAFKAAVAELKAIQEEELVLAVGEQNGVPNQGLTVPDAEGDIRLALDAPRSHDIDLSQLVAVLVTVLQDNASEDSDTQFAIQYAVEETVKALQGWGKVEPQVTKVKAWAATLARNGRDQDASVVKGAIREQTPTYRGVKFERRK